MSGAGAAIEVQICVTPDGLGLPLPAYMTDDAAGGDLFAAVKDDIVLERGERALIPAGFSIALPRGVEAHHSARAIAPATGSRGRHCDLRSADISQVVLGHWAGIRSHVLMN